MSWRARRAALCFVNAQVVDRGVTTLRVARGRVAAIGAAPQRGEVVIDLAGAYVYPGLVNAHDHLELNNFSRLKWRERYANASEWIADFQPRFKTDPDLLGPLAVPLEARLWIGGLKNLLSGVTTVAHHNPLHAALRRADFPVRVVQSYGFSHSLHMDGDAVASVYRRTPRDRPWIIHAAEGVDAAAAGELDRLAALGCLGANTLLVHGVGLTAEARARLAASGGGLVWCPASNLFMLGATAQVADLAAQGRVALGSDSRLSGAPDLLEELRCAAATGQVELATLYRMVTADAASLLRMADAGKLSVGSPADLLVLPPLAEGALTTLLAATRAEVGLVVLGGEPRYADQALGAAFTATGVSAAGVHVDGRPKLLSASLVQRLARLGVAEPGLVLREG
jgi:cytosine/adenosine deaminase-related metal-dependent hydrolase